jgi:maltose/moltooligosaccharide transporter
MSDRKSQEKVVFGGRIPRLNFWNMLNMALGFLGIQFAWSIQMGQMSGLYERLGATPSQVSWFWIAGPITGMIIQPIVGSMSDRTWCFLGRRRPYFLVGAILSSLALVAMPNSSTLWMAASLLWILDSSVNISMQPFRTLVADVAPEEQRGTAYSFQSFAIGVGSVLSFGLGGVVIFDWLEKAFGSSGSAFVAAIQPFCPTSLHALFYIGAIVFSAAILWTTLMTKEYPPADVDAFRAQKGKGVRLTGWLTDTWRSIVEMPEKMRKVCLMHSFTWFAYFCIFIFFSTMVAHNLFGATPGTPEYEKGIAWASLCFLAMNVVCFIAAVVIGVLTKYFRKKVLHGACLSVGAVAMISMYFISTPMGAMVAMAAMGIPWAATQSLPYALLSDVVPQERYGVYMGTFNLFICLPQIVCSLLVGPVVTLMGGNRALALVLGGISLVLAVLALRRVYEPAVQRTAERLPQAVLATEGEVA